MRLDLFAALCGILVAIQSRVNGGLSAILGNGVEAALISFGSGFIILNLILATNSKVRTGLRGVLFSIRSKQLPRWRLSAGILGGIFVAIQAFSVPLIGVALLSVTTIAGQTAASLFVDKAGMTAGGKQPITLRRTLAAVITVIAVLVAVWDRLTVANTSLIAIALSFGGGLLLGLQRALNGQINEHSKNSLATTWLNFATGCTFLSCLILFTTLSGDSLGKLPSSPWWIYSGGAIGILYIAFASTIVQEIGVLAFTLFTTGGQLIGSLLIDLIFPTEGVVIGPNLIIGIVLSYAGVLIGGVKAQGSIRAKSIPKNRDY
jgi:transporter family-2 protein